MSTDRERDLARLIDPKAFREFPQGMREQMRRDMALAAAGRIIAAGWMPRPEPGSAEEDAMVERAMAAFVDGLGQGTGGDMRAALRAALGTGGE